MGGAALRDDGACADRLDGFEDRQSVVGFVGDDMGRREAVEQRQRLGAVVGLPRREEEPDRAPAAIDREVDLGAQSTSGTPQSRILGPPFPVAACWCARTIVLSIIRYSLSRSRVRTVKRRSQTPFSAHRMNRLWTVLYLP